MEDGQHESLILGIGDLYGIVCTKNNNLFMRIAKNDIWDARHDLLAADAALRQDDLIRLSRENNLKWLTAEEPQWEGDF